MFVLPLLTGCFLIEQKTVILWTDIPEAAAYIELYNASQSDYRIELVYAENPGDYQKLVSDGAPDIVLAEALASNSIITAFHPFDKAMEDGLIDTEILYSDLCGLGKRTETLVLPVSFNIPAIMYKRNSLSEESTGLTISPEQLKAEAELFNESSTESFRVKGFAPSWTPDFMLYNAFINGSDFSEAADGSLIWNDTQLAASVEFCRDWTENINSGLQEEQDFTLTYCYDPGYKLLNAGRIGYYYTTLREFFTIPANDRSTLEFKWLGSESSIPVCEDIVYIGIPEKSDKKKAALEFIIWLFNEKTQKSLLEASQFKRTRSFGICNGLSSVQSVNELVMPEFYPVLIGNIPPNDYLAFPENLPADWMSIRNDVIIPWLANQCAEDPESMNLPDLLKTWTLQEQKK